MTEDLHLGFSTLALLTFGSDDVLLCGLAALCIFAWLAASLASTY
jgi:hypothetical protein